MAGSAIRSRFAALPDAFTYTYGDVDQFFAGLEGLIGLPVADFLHGMTLEHASEVPFTANNSSVTRETTPRAEWLYVTEREAGDASVPGRAADAVGRAGWRLRAHAAPE